MKPQITPDLLTNYFAGQATAFQKQLIDDWAKDPANREVFFAALAAWETRQPQYNANVDAAILRHQTRMAQFTQLKHEEADEEALLLRPAGRNWLVWRVAASIALLLLTGWLFRDNWQYKRYKTAYGQTQRITLPDGSRVVLNANSQLRIPRFGFGNSSREVLLSGEAFFDVTHTTDNQPFLVKTPQSFDVLVLGTEFSVYTRHKGGKVILNKGRVQLRYQDGRSLRKLIMKPGDLVMLDNTGLTKRRQLKEPRNELAWQHNRYVFDNTPLRTICQLFADNYGLQVELTNSELADWTVSGSFSAQSADELLDLLMQASSLTYTRKGKQIQISNPVN